MVKNENLNNFELSTLKQLLLSRIIG